MADDASGFLLTPRHAVVTGANKGIGLEICRKLAAKGIDVVLTSRDEKRGLEAICKLKEESRDELSGEVVFHQLDVTDPTSIGALAEFIRTRFRKLDILVNNAGILGTVVYFNALRCALEHGWPSLDEEAKMAAPGSYKLAVECVETNYYGTKRVTEALIPLLQRSNSARIVNVSGLMGQLQHIPGKAIRDTLTDIDNLTKDRIHEILKDYMEDFQQGQLEAKGWPVNISAYKVSKAALNAYTRLLAKEYPSFIVNCVHPGFVRTDITRQVGGLSPFEGAESIVCLALLPETGPSGFLFNEREGYSF